MKITLAASLVVNLCFVARFALLDQNILVRPLCWTNHHGLVALEGPQKYRYMEAFRRVGGPYDVRLDAEGYYYVSLLDYWEEEQYFWNATTKIVNQLVWEHGDEMALPPYEIEGPDRVKVTCELVQAVAIEPSPNL